MNHVLLAYSGLFRSVQFCSIPDPDNCHPNNGISKAYFLFKELLAELLRPVVKIIQEILIHDIIYIAIVSLWLQVNDWSWDNFFYFQRIFICLHGYEIKNRVTSYYQTFRYMEKHMYKHNLKKNSFPLYMSDEVSKFQIDSLKLIFISHGIILLTLQVNVFTIVFFVC